MNDGLMFLWKYAEFIFDKPNQYLSESPKVNLISFKTCLSHISHFNFTLLFLNSFLHQTCLSATKLSFSLNHKIMFMKPLKLLTHSQSLCKIRENPKIKKFKKC